jgi:predicted methyltransferase
MRPYGNTVRGLSVSIAVLFVLLTSLQSRAEQPAGNDKTKAALQNVIAGPHRSESNKSRDVYRHPLETLTWFGITEDMTVVEIWPGGGWYTEILAPFLKERGKYYAVGVDSASETPRIRESAQRFKDKLAANAELYSAVIVTELAPPKKIEIAPADSADMILTFRNVHSWMGTGVAEDVFVAMYRALKPGGILGVVAHRGDTATPQDPKAASGYVTEEHVITLAEAAGFQLVDRSDINANPKDTKDYPDGVWTLPPVLRKGEVDREKYLAIGESDRMTLKFTKPAAS